MPNGTLPDVDPSVRPADLERAGEWLDRHGLADTEPTPLLAARLAVRRRAPSGGCVLLAAFIIAGALATCFGGLPARRHVLRAVAAGADGVGGRVAGGAVAARPVGAARRPAGRRDLSRRAAHPVELGWRTVLGRPYAVFAVATFTGAMVLAVSVLPVSDSTLRQGRSSC